MGIVNKSSAGILGANFLLSNKAPILADEIVEYKTDLYSGSMGFYPGKVVAVLNEDYIDTATGKPRTKFSNMERWICTAAFSSGKATTSQSDWKQLDTNVEGGGVYRGVYDATSHKLDGDQKTLSTPVDFSLYNTGDFFRIKAYSTSVVEKYNIAINKIKEAASVSDASNITSQDILDAGILDVTLSDIESQLASIKSDIASASASAITDSSDLHSLIASYFTSSSYEIRNNYNYKTGEKDPQLDHKGGDYIVIEDDKIGTHIGFDSGGEALYTISQKSDFENRVKKLSTTHAIQPIDGATACYKGQIYWEEYTGDDENTEHRILYCRADVSNNILSSLPNPPLKTNSNWQVIATTSGSGGGSVASYNEDTMLSSDYSPSNLPLSSSYNNSTYVPAELIDARLVKLKNELTITTIDGGLIS